MKITNLISSLEECDARLLFQVKSAPLGKILLMFLTNIDMVKVKNKIMMPHWPYNSDMTSNGIKYQIVNI